MEIIIICSIVSAGLFIAAFITKKRFGLLGLALAAGSILNGIWAYEAGLVASLVRVPNNSYTNTAVMCLIILLPALMLLFHGDTYKSLVGRIIGAILFTLLAMAFLIEPLSHAFIAQGLGADIYRWMFNNRSMIIGVGLILAVIDLFFTKPAHKSNKHYKH